MAHEKDSEPGSNEPQWYIARVITGREQQIGEKLRMRISMMDLEDNVQEVYVPMHEEEQVKNGEKKKVLRNVYPGYILVKMVRNEDSWHAVRRTPGVTGFIDAMDEDGRAWPIKLEEDEVERIRNMAETGGALSASRFKAGDRVRVMQGPFRDFTGIVDDVNEEQSKLKIHVGFLGRETPVELNFSQVEEV